MSIRGERYESCLFLIDLKAEMQEMGKCGLHAYGQVNVFLCYYYIG